MNRKIIAALLGASLLAGGGAYAAQQSQSGPARHGPMMKADTNNDGIITRQEVLAEVQTRFAKQDTNKDGQLSVEERRAARPAHGGGARHGLGGPDGGQRHARMLERFDADKDGKLSDSERQAAREARQAMRGTGGGFGRGARHGMQMDTNGDKLVSLDESRAAALAMFDRMDANKDGRVDAAERDAAHAAMKAMRGHRGHGAGPHGGPVPAPAPSDAN